MTPVVEVDAPLDLQHFVPYRLSVIANTVSRALAQRYSDEFGLNVPQWRVMAVLGREPGLSAIELTERTAMDKVAVSRAVSGLVTAGRVAQRNDPHDGRRKRLRLTRSGRRIYQRIVPRARELERALLAELAPAQRDALEQLLPELQAAAQRVAAQHAAGARAASP